jgi:hypothetical protein
MSDPNAQSVNARFSRTSISFTRSEHRVSITRACKSIWSLSSFVKYRIFAQDDDDDDSLKSMFREVWCERGEVRESIFK